MAEEELVGAALIAYRLEQKMNAVPNEFVLNEYVEITEAAGAPGMVGKMGKIVNIEPAIDLYEEGSKLPDGVEIPEGAAYIEVGRWEITVQFPLGNTRIVTTEDIKSVTPVNAADGVQGVGREGSVHLVNPNLRFTEKTALKDLSHPEISSAIEQPEETTAHIKDTGPRKAEAAGFRGMSNRKFGG